MIVVSLDGESYLVTLVSEENDVVAAVRFARRSDADAFALVWQDWIGDPEVATASRALDVA